VSWCAERIIVTRHRRGLQSGRSPEDAAVTAIDTSGRAVLFAGGTVCIAILGILVLGLGFLNGLAVACALTVVFTVLAAITLLPALLGVFGWRVLSRRQRRRLANRPAAQAAGGVWARWAGTVERRPAVLAAAAAAVMVVLAIPVLSLRLGSSDQGNDSSSYATRQAYDLLAKAPLEGSPAPTPGHRTPKGGTSLFGSHSPGAALAPRARDAGPSASWKALGPAS
jgi:putative drug exporter of the RND superfamily